MVRVLAIPAATILALIAFAAAGEDKAKAPTLVNAVKGLKQ